MRKRTAGTLWLILLVAGCGPSGPGGPPQRIRAFSSADAPITQSGVTAEEGGWRVTRATAGSVPLFEVADPGVEQAMLTYRARLKARDAQGQAYLEMWVRVPGHGEAFSRGLDQPLRGTTDWTAREIPFFLKQGERADLVKLNLAFEGAGTVWIRDVELLKTPLSR